MARITRQIGIGMAWAVWCLVPAAAGGQSGTGGQLELGTFGIFTRYDQTNLSLNQEFGAGGRLGIFLSKTLSFEASGDYTETATTALNRRISVTRLGGTLIANARLAGYTGLYLGAGYERTFYRLGEQWDDDGFHVVLGPKLSLGGRAALRIQGRASYFLSSGAPGIPVGAKPLNLSASAGLSIYAFGGAPRDSDRDGVGNSGDTCPDTPLGAQVDTAGCPTDDDTDGVFDGLDQCPGTPGGALVDPAGCPSDDDDDGVFNGIDICPDTPGEAVADANGCPSDPDTDGVFDGVDQCADTPAGAVVDAVGCPADEDADGVFDGIDQCPGTPAGVTVDTLGCPADEDGDGVTDDLDQCPGTPAGATVDATGCQPETDTDGDTILDSQDQCPGTPAGTIVDSTGCPAPADTDGDGVIDSEDRCPGTPTGTTVDAVGCPVLFVVAEGAERVQPLVLQGVTFASGSSRLTQQSFAVLDQVALSLIANAEVRIEVGGHTDATGSLAANRRISLARAEAVRAYLVQQGVPVNRMEARGYGPDQPIASNRTASGRAQNRRVELKRIDQN